MKLSLSLMGILTLTASLLAITTASGGSPEGEALPIPSSEKITEDCLFCHEDFDRTLAGTVHAILEEGSRVACSDCHAGAPVHIEDPEPSNIGRPDSLSVAGEFAVCSTCHLNSHQQSMAENNRHAVGGINCSGCHRIHDNGSHPRLLRDEQVELCLGCHADVRSDFNKAFRHPVWDGILRCTQCHQLLEEKDRQFSYAGLNEVCFQCHAQFRGPFPYEHQATVGYSTHEGGCLNCHAAHGSSLPRMTNQTYEAPNYALCSQCHSVPRHQNNIMHGSTWAGVPCSDCHVDIHGSYTNRLFVSPALEVAGCFNAGCHGL